MGIRPHDPYWRYAHGTNVRAVEVGRRGWNAAAGVVRIALTGWRRVRRRGSAACGMTGVEDGRGARLPESAPCRLSAQRITHEGCRIAASFAPVEVRRRAAPDELDVRIHAVPFHVPKQSAIAAVRSRRGSISSTTFAPIGARLSSAVLAAREKHLAGAQLRSIHLQQTHPPTIAKRERVAVVHGSDYANFSVLRFATRGGPSRAESGSEHDHRRNGRCPSPCEPTYAVVRSPQPQSVGLSTRVMTRAASPLAGELMSQG